MPFINSAPLALFFIPVSRAYSDSRSTSRRSRMKKVSIPVSRAYSDPFRNERALQGVRYQYPYRERTLTVDVVTDPTPVSVSIPVSRAYSDKRKNRICKVQNEVSIPVSRAYSDTDKAYAESFGIMYQYPYRERTLTQSKRQRSPR